VKKMRARVRESDDGNYRNVTTRRVWRTGSGNRGHEIFYEKLTLPTNAKIRGAVLFRPRIVSNPGQTFVAVHSFICQSDQFFHLIRIAGINCNTDRHACAGWLDINRREAIKGFIHDFTNFLGNHLCVRGIDDTCVTRV
jgi:hypothetical protein